MNAAKTNGQATEPTNTPPELAAVKKVNELRREFEAFVTEQREQLRELAEQNEQLRDRVDELEQRLERVDGRTDAFRIADRGENLDAEQRHYLLLEAVKRKARNKSGDNRASIGREEAAAAVPYPDDVDRTLPTKDLQRTADRFGHIPSLDYRDGRLRINLDLVTESRQEVEA